jgi:hypothetical protein
MRGSVPDLDDELTLSERSMIGRRRLPLRVHGWCVAGLFANTGWRAGHGQRTTAGGAAMGGTKDIAMKVAMAAVTDVVKTATQAMQELTEAITGMAQSLRRIEQLLDEQTDYLVETKEVVAEQADILSATSGASAKKASSAKPAKSA